MTTYEPEIDAARVGGKLPALERECVKILLARLIASRTDDKRQPHLVRSWLRELCKEDGEPSTVDELIEWLIANATFIVKAVTETAECGLSARRIGKHDLEGNKIRAEDQARIARENLARHRDSIPKGGAEPTNGGPCKGCGMSNHPRATCSLTGHPDYNASGDWAASKPGKLYAAAKKNRLRFGEDVKGGPNGQIKTPRTQPGGGGGKPKGNKTWARKDTGAVMGDYCSKEIGNWVRITHPECWQEVEVFYLKD
ncbi:hypothetical protein B484DRAFT_420652 [Ochromonadaceae sp. CCMP2298]|nr:hypothetical protein B484DRAFT_420652 [Ochromonadaceae sp. CCMP2298]